MPNVNDNREEIREFLQEQFDNVEEDGGVTVVGLEHIAHTGEVALHSFKSSGAGFGNADKMSTTLHNIASRHARGVAGGGVQQYHISICRGPEGRVTTVLPFIRIGSTSQTGIMGSLATEPPTEMGRLQQSMRWGEQQVQMSYEHTKALMASQQRAIDTRDSKIEATEKINGDLWLACKSLLMELDKQRHDVRMQELNAARMAEFQRQVMVLAPSILNMISGKEVFPMATADTAMVDAIAAWASPEDLQILVGTLSTKPGGDKLGAVLMERFKQYRDRKSAENKEEKRLMGELPGRTFDQAEEDAAGNVVRQLLAGKFDGTLGGNGNGGGNGSGPKALGKGKKQTSTVEAPETEIGGALSEAGQDEAQKLWDDLFSTVPENQIEMLTTVLSGSKPELAARIKRMYEERAAAR